MIEGCHILQVYCLCIVVGKKDYSTDVTNTKI